jgi:hypothetical protein
MCCAAARPAPAAPSGAGRRRVATVLALTLHAPQGHASGGRSAVDLATAGARGRPEGFGRSGLRL